MNLTSRRPSPFLESLRPVGRWAAACAARALPLYQAHFPRDFRPRAAVAGAREFANRGERTGKLRALAWGAHAAARDADDAAASAAARAACLAAAVAYTHPLATAHQTRHVLAPAAYAALARERGRQGDSRVGDREVRWAIAKAPPAVRALVRRMVPVVAGRGRLGTLLRQLDAGLRARSATAPPRAKGSGGTRTGAGRRPRPRR